MIRGFHWLSQAWYASAFSVGRESTDEVSFGFYDSTDGGTTGEMTMHWYDLGTAGITPRLEVFDDAWDALYWCPDVLAALAERDNQDITPVQFCEMLNRLGFADLTKREDPYQAPKAPARRKASKR
jgi:hypothetical protein